MTTTFAPLISSEQYDNSYQSTSSEYFTIQVDENNGFVPIDNENLEAVFTENIRINWNHVEDGIERQVWDVTILNDGDDSRDLDIDPLIDQTSFAISQLSDFLIELEYEIPIEVQIPIFENVAENIWIWDDGDNILGHWSEVITEKQTGTVSQLKWINSRIEITPQNTFVSDLEYRVSLASFDVSDELKSQVVYLKSEYVDAKLAAYELPTQLVIPAQGTANLRISYRVPIQRVVGGWGSTGRLAIVGDVASDPWWDGTWSCRSPISVIGSHPENYQIKIIVPHRDDMQPDYDDLRFFENEATGSLDYWIENYTADNATVWVRRLENLDNTIYVYYGNAAAASVENGDRTFVLFDHFLGSSLDAGKWVTVYGTPTVGNSELTLQNHAGKETVRSVLAEGTGYAFMFKAKLKNNADLQSGWANSFNDLSDASESALEFGGLGILYLRTRQSGSATTQNGSWAQWDTYAVYEIRRPNSSSVILLGNNDNVVKNTTNISTSSLNVAHSTASTTGPLVIDWSIIRKCIDPEPATNMGEEENSGSAQWWDEDWCCRRPIAIIGTHSENYQIKVVVPNDSDMQDNYGDLRFLENVAAGELNYWIENYTEDNATVWVRRLENLDNTIYLYYGNPSAQSAANAFNTFVFFDDFNNDERWSGSKSGYEFGANDSGTIGLKIKGVGDSNYLIYTTSFTWQYGMFEMRTRSTATGSGAGDLRSLQHGTGDTSWDYLTGDLIMASYESSTNNITEYEPSTYYSYNFGTVYHILGYGWTPDNYFTCYVDNDNLGSNAHTPNNNYLKFNSQYSKTDKYVDWVRVRKLVVIEPIASVGEEEVNISTAFGYPPNVDFTGGSVNTSTGNFVLQQTDVAASRGWPINFVRTYNSLEDYIGPFGKGWTHNYNVRLSVRGSLIYLIGEDGKRDIYLKEDSGITPLLATYADLENVSSSVYVLTRPGGTKLTFSDLLLDNVTDRFGNCVRLYYDNGHLSAVRNSDDWAMAFQYDNQGKLIRAYDNRDPTRYVTYEYDENSNLVEFTDIMDRYIQYVYSDNRLVSLVRPLGNAPFRILMTATEECPARLMAQIMPLPTAICQVGPSPPTRLGKTPSTTSTGTIGPRDRSTNWAILITPGSMTTGTSPKLWIRLASKSSSTMTMRATWRTSPRGTGRIST